MAEKFKEKRIPNSRPIVESTYMEEGQEMFTIRNRSVIGGPDIFR